MNAVKVNYCNSSGYLLTNERTKYDIITSINNKLNRNILENNNVNYSDKYETILKKNVSMTTFISSGKKVMLYLTKINNDNTCFIIELQKSSGGIIYPKIFNIILQFDEDLYSNTLIGAEIYKNKYNWNLLLDEILIYKNNIYDKHIQLKIRLLNTIVDSKFKSATYDSISIYTKKWFYILNINKMLNDTNIALNGVKFYYKNKTIVFNFSKDSSKLDKYKILPNINSNTIKQDTIKLLESYNEENIETKLMDIDEKWKLNTEYIVDIIKHNTYGLYNIRVYDNKNNQKILGIMRTPSIEISLKLLELFKNHRQIKVSVKLNTYFNKYEFISFNNSNSLDSYENIIQHKY